MENPMDRTPLSWMLTPSERRAVAALRTPRARQLATLALTAGLRGGADESDDAENPSPVERLAQLHEVLTNDEARTRLSDAEVESFRGELAEMFHGARRGEVVGIERTDTEAMRRISECVIAARDEMAGREAAAAAADAEIDAIAADAGLAEAGDGKDGGDGGDGGAGGEGGPGDGGDGGAGGDGADAENDDEKDDDDDDEKDDDASDASSGGEQEAEAVLAGAGPVPVPSLRDLNTRSPHLRRDAARVQVGDRVGADIVWLPTNERVTMDEFIAKLTEYPGSHLHSLPMGQKVILGQRATIAENAPRIDSRRDSAEAISRKLDEAVAGALDPANWSDGTPSEALVASGGWGPPAPVAYDVQTLADAERSVRACLASVGADRGGLTFVRPPSYASVTQGGPGVANAATGIWTAVTDANPGNTVKGRQVVPNPPAITRQLDAVYMSLQFGVLQARSFNELVRAWTTNTEAAWADEGDRRLLDLIEGFAITLALSQAIVVGATRDFIAHHISLAAQERRRQRMRPDAMLRLMYPSWVEDLVQIDLLRAGTSFTDGPPEVVAREFVRRSFAAANINACPLRTDSTFTRAGGANRAIQAEVNQTDFNELPLIARSYLFHEGALVVGDGGTENIGIVRDEDLVNTNDFRIFTESFETVFDRGIWVYVTDVYLCPSGAAGGAVDLTGLCGGSA